MRLALVSVCIATALGPSVAWAQGDPCEERIRAGVSLRRTGRDAEALETFRAGLEACPNARMRVQLAWAEQAMGLWVAAAEHLRAALREDVPWITERRARLEGDLAVIERHVGRLEILGGVDGAEVLLDGAQTGALPWTEPRALPAGVVRLEVRRAGYYPVSREVTLTAGQVTREQVEMRPEAPAPVETRPVTTPVVVTPPPVTPSIRPRVTEPSRARRVVAWSLAGGGALALIAGSVAWALREASAAEFNEAHGGACFEHEGVAYGGPDCEPLRARVSGYQTAAVVTLAAGAALGVASAVLFVTAPSARERTAAWVRCAPWPLGLVCGGTF